MTLKEPSRLALLVVDVQEGLVARKLYGKESFLSAIRSAIAVFRQAGDPIVFIRHEGAIVKRGTPEWELYSGLDPRANDPIIDKRHGDAFEETGLAKLLEKRGVGHVVVCGLVSHGCVRATCLGAKALGFDAGLLALGHSNWAKDAAAKIEAVERELSAVGIEALGIDRI